MLPSFITSVLFGDSPSQETSTGLSEPITAKTTIKGDVNQAGLKSYAFSGMQGWRMTMEDAHMVCTNIPVDGKREPLPCSIFGVMDGHGGDFTSDYASKNFMEIFSANSRLRKYAGMSTEEQSNVPGLECLKTALSETFSRLDVEIRKQQNIRNEKKFLEVSKQQEASNTPVRVRYERSGSTCIVALVTPSHIICANAGDSRAILQRGGKALPLSFDHKPNNAPEMERIQHANGFVKCKRVDGDLAVSRGLGDFTYKSNELLRVDQQKVRWYNADTAIFYNTAHVRILGSYFFTFDAIFLLSIPLCLFRWYLPPNSSRTLERKMTSLSFWRVMGSGM